MLAHISGHSGGISGLSPLIMASSILWRERERGRERKWRKRERHHEGYLKGKRRQQNPRKKNPILCV
jgi:hypothetical protein